VNLKYALADNLFARAAYYAAVVRPGFGDMAPIALFNDDRDELEMGNPNLKPYEADNYDLSIEYYPTQLSVLSAGVFYKSIDNAIFPATYEIEDLPVDIDLLPGCGYVAGSTKFRPISTLASPMFAASNSTMFRNLASSGKAFDGFLPLGQPDPGRIPNPE
jgi:outer membrane receptor protein involved in Fe transport